MAGGDKKRRDRDRSRASRSSSAAASTPANAAAGGAAGAAAGATAPGRPLRPRVLDFFKQLPIRREPIGPSGGEDGIPTYASSEAGSSSSGAIGDGDAAQQQAPQYLAPAMVIPKKDIPTPIISEVASYKEDQAPTFQLPPGYIRFPNWGNGDGAGRESPPPEEYFLDLADERWLDTHARYGEGRPATEREKLIKPRLEHMLGMLERKTGFGDPVQLAVMESLFASLGMSKAVHKEVWSDVYAYWKQKRTKLGKPLLRKFWPVTPTNDTDPHKVFRTREKERFKLRSRHRKNDLDSYRKLQQIKEDFKKAEAIAKLVVRRERMKRAALLLQGEIFDQALWDLTDTTGKARPLKVDPQEYKLKHTLKIPQAVVQDHRSREEQERARKAQKKRRRDGGGRHGATATAAEGEDEETPAAGAAAAPGGAGGAGSKTNVPVLPSFMDPLSTRENIPGMFRIEPALPVYTVQPRGPGRRPRAAVESVHKFVCRGRIGRGGRVVFDRVPVPSPSYGGGGGGKGKGKRMWEREGAAEEEEEAEAAAGMAAPPQRVVAAGAAATGGMGLMLHEKKRGHWGPLVISNGGQDHPLQAPSVLSLHAPMLNRIVDERRFKDICAMDDDQEEMLEYEGLSQVDSMAADPSQRPPVVKYVIHV